MYTLLMVFFVFLCIFLGFFILLQQGKGDLGVGSMQGSQMLFGGSGGQGFFEKATWIMGALFILGSLGLAIVKSRETQASILEGYTAPKVQPIQPITTQAKTATSGNNLATTATTPDVAPVTDKVQ